MTAADVQAIAESVIALLAFGTVANWVGNKVKKIIQNVAILAMNSERVKIIEKEGATHVAQLKSLSDASNRGVSLMMQYESSVKQAQIELEQRFSEMLQALRTTDSNQNHS